MLTSSAEGFESEQLIHSSIMDWSGWLTLVWLKIENKQKFNVDKNNNKVSTGFDAEIRIVRGETAMPVYFECVQFPWT
jgi:hypothetical protein